MDKRELRKELKSLRNTLSISDTRDYSRSICARITASKQYAEAKILLGYLAFGREPNIDFMLEQALADGKQVCVPVVVDDITIVPMQYRGLSFLQNGRYDIRIPAEPLLVTAKDSIDLVLVPGVGFDYFGNRMGMGAGYYDRLLPQISKAILVGITYEILLRPQIPVDKYDISVDYLVTEKQFITCNC